jgi:hypothetical protein
MYHKEHLQQLQILYLVILLVELQPLLVFVQGDSWHKRFFPLLHEGSRMHFAQKQDMRKILSVKKSVPTIPIITKIDLNFLIA